MSRTDLMEIVENMKELMGVETLLDNLCQALSSDDLKGNLEYIDRMFETGQFNDEDEEEEEE